MNYDYIGILKKIFECAKITQKKVNSYTESLPMSNVRVCCRSGIESQIPSASHRYSLLFHSSNSLYGVYGVLSIRHELYLDGSLSSDKSEIYYASVPRLMLAILDLLLPLEAELTDSDLESLGSKISNILSTATPVNNKNLTYLSCLSVGLRQTILDLKTLRQSVKLLVLQESNLHYFLNDDEIFRKEVFLLLDQCSNLISKSDYKQITEMK